MVEPQRLTRSVEHDGAHDVTMTVRASRRARLAGSCEPRRLARLQLLTNLAQGAEPLSDDVVLVDRLQVDLTRRHERAVIEIGERADDAGDHLPHAVLDEPRAPVRLLDDVRLVRALHQLVDLGGHRLLDDLEQLTGVDLVVAQLGAADVQRAEAALVVGRHRHRLEDAFDVRLVEALVVSRARGGGDELLGAWAGRHPLRGDADQPAGPEVGADR